MLERLLKTQILANHPLYLFIIALCYVLLTFALSIFIFPVQDVPIAFPMVLSIIIAITFAFILSWEEKVETKVFHGLKEFLGEQLHVLEIYFFTFFGLVAGFFIIGMFTPQGVKEMLFARQLVHYKMGATASFLDLLLNNLGVLIYTFVLSVLYGAGAVFVLVWNATFFGLYLAQYLSVDFLKMFPHAVIEVVGYLAGAISGGLISEAIINERKRELLFRVLKRAAIFLALSVILITASAYMEALVLAP